MYVMSPSQGSYRLFQVHTFLILCHDFLTLARTRDIHRFMVLFIHCQILQLRLSEKDSLNKQKTYVVY